MQFNWTKDQNSDFSHSCSFDSTCTINALERERYLDDYQWSVTINCKSWDGSLEVKLSKRFPARHVAIPWDTVRPQIEAWLAENLPVLRDFK